MRPIQIGEIIITKYDGKLIECKVIKLLYEEIQLEYKSHIFLRKWHEVRKIPFEEIK